MRSFVIFESWEVPLINFDEVIETSANTLRYSVDGTKTFVKWEGSMPNSVKNLTTRSIVYTYEEMLVIVSSPEWNAEKA